MTYRPCTSPLGMFVVTLVLTVLCAFAPLSLTDHGGYIQ